MADERWTILVSDGAVIGGAADPDHAYVDPGLMHHERIEVVPVSVVEGLEAENESLRQKLIQANAFSVVGASRPLPSSESRWSCPAHGDHDLPESCCSDAVAAKPPKETPENPLAAGSGEERPQ